MNKTNYKLLHFNFNVQKTMIFFFLCIFENNKNLNIINDEVFFIIL